MITDRTMSYVITFFVCIILCSLGRRLQGGLIDRIFFGKKVEWKTVDNIAVKPEGKLREKEGSFGTTKARLVYALMSTIAFVSTTIVLKTYSEKIIDNCVVAGLMFVFLYVGQIFGAFNSLNAGWIVSYDNNNNNKRMVTFDKKLAIKHYCGLTMMGICYCIAPTLLTIYTISLGKYVNSILLIIPFLWYFGYYYAWKSPTQIKILETQYDDPMPTGELITGGLLGVYIFFIAMLQ